MNHPFVPAIQFCHRLLSSQDKAPVSAEIQTTEPKPEYEKIVKAPYVMEFLEIKPDSHVFDSDLEQALINHLQQFLPEPGKGVSFIVRQKRFSLDGRNFYIDFVWTSDSFVGVCSNQMWK